MLNLSKIIFINITILILGLFTLELFFGSWLKYSNHSNLLIPRQQKNIIDNFPYKHDSLGMYSRDKYGFRSNSYDLNKINILILGGSTTEEREVDDDKIWTKIFEKNLKTNKKVLNAGIGGQTSYGHKLMYDMWFKKYSDLNPNFIIIYLGINDALYLVENINKVFMNGRQINSSNRDTLVSIRTYDRTIQYIKNNSIFHSVYLIIKGNIISKKYNISYQTKPSFFTPYKGEVPENLQKIDKQLLDKFKNYYYQNLNEIVKQNKTYGAETIFITQPLSNTHWLKNYLKIINLFTLEFCEINKIHCINIENKSLKLSEIFFYDGIHTTPEGSRIIGKFIAKEFNNFYF